MTDLRQLMQQTVEHESADLVRLASRARKHGTVMRRRRRVAVVGGSFAAVVSLVVGFGVSGSLPFAGGDDRASYADGTAVTGLDPSPGESPSAQPTSVPTACSDRRSDVEHTDAPEAGVALRSAVAALGSGVITRVHAERSSASCHHPEAVAAYLSYSPEQGAPAGQVAVSFMQDEEFAYAGGAAAYVSSCDVKEVQDCHLSTLPDGTTLRTYAIRQDLAGGTWTILVADRLVGDQVISVQSQGPRANDADGTVLGGPVLSTAQVSDVAAALTWIG